MTEASQQTKDQKPRQGHDAPKGPVPYDDGDIGTSQSPSTDGSDESTSSGGGRT